MSFPVHHLRNSPAIPQVLECKHPELPLTSGKVERRELGYKRHGTRAFILSRDAMTGKLHAPQFELRGSLEVRNVANAG